MKANPTRYFKGIGTEVLDTAKPSHTFFPAGWSEEMVMSLTDDVMKTTYKYTLNSGNNAKYIIRNGMYHVAIFDPNTGIVKSSYITLLLPN
jgi:hypothetical protein